MCGVDGEEGPEAYGGVVGAGGDEGGGERGGDEVVDAAAVAYEGLFFRN